MKQGKKRGFTGIVLAGGASRRMGRDKAQLWVEGITLLEHMRLLLHQAGASRVVVLGRNDVEGAVPDARPLQGPAIAVQDYLRMQPVGSRHLVVPVDMPGLSVDLLSTLASQTDWAYFHGYQMPFLGVADGKQPSKCVRIGELLSEKMAHAIAPDNHRPAVFSNINKPSDLDAFFGLKQMQASIT